jgi:hypothetical protein
VTCESVPCSPASADSTSGSNGRASRRRGKSSSTPTAVPYLSLDSLTLFDTSTFETSAPTTSPPSKSSAADFRARGSASPAGATDTAMHARVFGPSSRASLANFDPTTSSWRTCQRSVLGDSVECLVTWPRSGMTRSGTAYARATSARRIAATDSGLWPTPQSRDWKNGTGQGNRRSPNLNAVVVELSRDRPQSSTPRWGRRLWPTPKSSPSGPDFARINRPRSGGDDLATAVARDVRETRSPTPGQLNPTWVEWLMGFPLGWTVLRPSATPSSRNSPSGSVGASSRGRR